MGRNQEAPRDEGPRAVGCSVRALSSPSPGWHWHLGGFTRLPGASSGQNPQRLSGYRCARSYGAAARHVKGMCNSPVEPAGTAPPSTPSRVVDASALGRLAERIAELLGPGTAAADRWGRSSSGPSPGGAGELRLSGLAQSQKRRSRLSLEADESSMSVLEKC